MEGSAWKERRAIILNIACNNLEQVILNGIKTLESLDLQDGRLTSFGIMQLLASNNSVSWVQTFVVKIAFPRQAFLYKGSAAPLDITGL